MAKSFFLIVVFAIINSQQTYAQESEKYSKLKSTYKYNEGYIIDLDSVKKYGIIKEPPPLNPPLIHHQITFVGKDGAKGVYYPADLIGYKKTETDYISLNGVFYKIEKSGENLNLLSKTTINVHGSAFYEEFYFQKVNDQSVILISKRQFPKYFSEYFSDCYSLKTHILNGGITHKNIKWMMQLYDECRLKKPN